MGILLKLFTSDLKRRSRDGFVIGYNIIFPVVMILLLGYLASGSYGDEFTGYQYYSVVMPPFCISMAIITAAYAGKDDAYRKTAVRFLFSPVSKTQIVLSKLLSVSFVISFSNLVLILLSWLVLKLPVQDSIIPVFILLAAESFAVCAIGLFIGFGMKNFVLIKNLINIPVCLAAVLAGAFYPIGTLNTGLAILLKLSPLTWVNRGIFLSIYDGNTAILWRTAIIFIVTGLCFTLLAIRFFKKEEYIHGDLPGYEK